MPRVIKTTLALDGEQKFKQGLQSIDREMRVMQAEIKNLTSKYNDNAESMKNLSEVQKALQDKVTLSANKVEILKEAVETSNTQYKEAVKHAEAMAEKHGKNSKEALLAEKNVTKLAKAYDEYRIKLSNAEDVLNKSKKELENFNEEIYKSQKSDLKDTFEKISKSAKEISTKLAPVIKDLGEFSAKAAKISFKAAETGAKAFSKTAETAFKASTKAVAAYTAALSAAGTALLSTVESTKEYRSDLSKLEQAARTSGNSFDSMKSNLSDLAALTGETDSSIEALNNLMATGFTDNQIATAIDSLSGAVIKFPDTLKIESLADSLQETIATGGATGQYAELIERLGYNLDDFNAELAACTTEAERQQYALDFLANSGLAEVNAEYQIANEAALNYEKSQMRLTDATAKLGEATLPIATGLKEYAADFIEIFAAMLTGSTTSADDLQDKLDELAKNLTTGINKFLPSATTLFNTIIKTLGRTIGDNLPVIFETVLPTLIDGTSDLILSLTDALPEYLPTIISGAITLFDGLLTGFNDVISSLVSNLPETIDNITDELGKNDINILNIALELFNNLITGFETIVDRLVPKLPGFLTKIANQIISNAPTLLNSALQMFAGLLEGLSDTVEELTPLIPGFIEQICDVLIKNIGPITDAAWDLLMGLADGLIAAIPTLLEKLPQVITSLVGEITKPANLTMLLNTGIDLIEALAEGLPNTLTSISDNIDVVITNIVAFIMDTDWAQVGKDIVNGILSGFLDMEFEIDEYIGEFADNWKSGIKEAFDIHSPSRWMRDNVGKNLALGLGIGFTDNMKTVSTEMLDSVPRDFETSVNVDTMFDKVDRMVSGHGYRTTNNTTYSAPITIVIERADISSHQNIIETGELLAKETNRQLIGVGMWR